MSKTQFKKLIVRFNEPLTDCLQRSLLDEAIILMYDLKDNHKSWAVGQIKCYWEKISGNCTEFWKTWYQNQLNHLEPRDLPESTQEVVERPDYAEPITESF